jgi:hypothetical protein
MKKVIFVLSLFILFSSCNTVNKKPKKIEIKVDVGNKIIYQSFHVNRTELYPVKITLINNTDSAQQFWVMSCSWEGSFVFNSDIISFFNLGCDKDIVINIKLVSGEIKTYNGYLSISNKLNLRNMTNLKLGFILIRNDISYSESVFSKVLREKKRKKEDVIWCDVPLKFKL